MPLLIFGALVLSVIVRHEYTAAPQQSEVNEKQAR
jgi:hypothetical protein